ncbi:Ger(x)C family spore germination protein [Cohnella hashimotonis]|uniref:Ger(X)C family spore germination protein n=1 Tax=Cohnella hashimotonis TaxID=2826895 RepID=A0ABT6THK7_9BACL|nr:Ger(x)C family spore germination protein [Cohnella hashimotonis]MDI4646312.1 Ger(x)C family spore germination protein [Cohnella hashimotonis]
MLGYARALGWIAILFVLGGCWDMVEVSRSSLITGVALEPGQERDVRVTIEVLNAAESMSAENGRGDAPAKLYTAEADTLSEAVNRMNEQFDRMLIGSHMQVIVVDERLARQGLNRFMDFFVRSRYVREDVNLIISKKNAASELLRIPYPGGMNAALAIQSQIYNLNRIWGGASKSRMIDYTIATQTPGRELLLAGVSVEGPVSQNIDSVKTLEPKSSIRLTDTAVFKGDKLIGFLPSADMNIVLLANDNLEQTTVSVPMPQGKAFAGVRLIRLHASKSVRMLHGKPKMTLNVQGVGFIVSLGAGLPIDQAAGYLELERLTEDYVRKRIEATVEKVQTEYGSDIFGFGEWMYRHRFGEFKRISASWNELFAKGELSVDVDIQLERSELKTKNHADIQ